MRRHLIEWQSRHCGAGFAPKRRIAAVLKKLATPAIYSAKAGASSSERVPACKSCASVAGSTWVRMQVGSQPVPSARLKRVARTRRSAHCNSVAGARLNLQAGRHRASLAHDKGVGMIEPTLRDRLTAVYAT